LVRSVGEGHAADLQCFLKSEDLFGRVDLDGEGRVAEFERVTEDDDEEREDSVAELMKHDEGGRMDDVKKISLAEL
jgi:hypothetical protein